MGVAPAPAPAPAPAKPGKPGEAPTERVSAGNRPNAERMNVERGLTPGGRVPDLSPEQARTALRD